MSQLSFRPHRLLRAPFLGLLAACGPSGGTSAYTAGDSSPPVDSFNDAAKGTISDASTPTSVDAASDSSVTVDAGSPNLWADASGTVEVFVNGVSLGRSSGDGTLFTVSAALIPGAENVVVLRASKGASSNPFAHAEVSGAFGKIGTERMWKVKAAAGTEATDPTGAWATLAYDDSAWADATNSDVATSFPFPDDAHVDGVWTSSTGDTTILLRAKIYLPADYSPGMPKGFGTGVTGGAGGQVVTVTNISDLRAALCGTTSGGLCTDTTPRIVQVPSQVFDFTGTEGTTAKTVCYQQQCSTGQSEYRVDDGYCTGRTTWTAQLDSAALDPLLIGSNKSLIGIGPGATLKGKGIAIRGGVSNVIVRNVTITNLNPQVIWGGDAITIDNATNVWIDHDRISLIGRMMLVTGWGQASKVTISWNEFDGVTPYSASCNDTHYWLWLFLGANDTLTLENNWVHDTAGRGPHAGGLLDARVLAHLFNNFYNYVPGHALDAESNNYTSGGTAYSDLGSLFAEGNYFDRVDTPVLIEAANGQGFGPGDTFAPIASNLSSAGAACQTGVGRACVPNVALPANGTWPLDQGVMKSMAGYTGVPAPYAAEEVPFAVPHLAGPGHL
jgi:pectin lyase